MNKYKKCHKSKLILENPEKCHNGDYVQCKSGLEEKWMTKIDTHTSFIEWSYEKVHIPYYYKRKRIYEVDLWARVLSSNGDIKEVLIEIKHSKSLNRPKGGRNFSQNLEEWEMNQAKWEAAREYAKHHGMEFHVLTEKSLYD